MGSVVILGGRSLFASSLYPSKKNDKLTSGSRENYRIFSEGQIGNLKLKNRIVRSAAFMGMSGTGILNEQGIAYYKALVEGGVGLIISGHMGIMKVDPSDPWYMSTRINHDDCIPNIRPLAEAVHQADNRCKVIAQINHVGMQDIIEHPISPSGIWPGSEKEYHVLSTEEVEGIVNDFIDAADRSQKAGFDGAQLHSAHGYLLSTFLSSYSNRRTDKYGGSTEKRVTIIREIVEGIRIRNGPDFPVLIKMNADDMIPGGINMESFPELAKEVAKTGVDAIEISSNHPIRKEIDTLESQSYHLAYAEKLNLDIPVILTGGNKSVEQLEHILQKGQVDFMGFARPLIREPDLPARWLKGSGNATCDCISCNECFTSLTRGETAKCQLI